MAKNRSIHVRLEPQAVADLDSAAQVRRMRGEYDATRSTCVQDAVDQYLANFTSSLTETDEEAAAEIVRKLRARDQA